MSKSTTDITEIMNNLKNLGVMVDVEIGSLSNLLALSKETDTAPAESSDKPAVGSQQFFEELFKTEGEAGYIEYLKTKTLEELNNDKLSMGNDYVSLCLAYDYLEALKYLIERGHNFTFDSKNSFGMSHLNNAVSSGCIKIAKFIAENCSLETVKGNDKDMMNQNPLRTALNDDLMLTENLKQMHMKRQVVIISLHAIYKLRGVEFELTEAELEKRPYLRETISPKVNEDGTHTPNTLLFSAMHRLCNTPKLAKDIGNIPGITAILAGESNFKY